jgi:S-adenosylmethionine-diacylglycerol 3-amino-3-carboxypropyl transferase
MLIVPHPQRRQAQAQAQHERGIWGFVREPIE